MKIIIFAPQNFNIINNKVCRWIFYPVETVSVATVLRDHGYNVLGVDLNLYNNLTGKAVRKIVRDIHPKFAVIVSQWITGLLRQGTSSLHK